MSLQIVQTNGRDDLATVFVARLDDGSLIEMVESLQPPIPRTEKTVLIVSTLKGCPVGCPICDAGRVYEGKLSAEQIVSQVEFLVRRRHPDGRSPVRKLKVQLARMGDPALNDAVLDALELLPQRLESPGLMPSFSTVAPDGRDGFMQRLADIKSRLYGGGRFQMQFSIHTTDDGARRAIIPIRTWSLQRIASYGDAFHRVGDRKITLNFAPVRGLPLDPNALVPLFSPERFIVKLTPINPTFAALESGLTGLIDPGAPGACKAIAARFESAGYETILSIGELEENEIGSNCGMYVTAMKQRAS